MFLGTLLPAWLNWDNLDIRTTARPWLPWPSTPGRLSSPAVRSFPSLLAGALPALPIKSTVVPATLSTHLLSDQVVSYNVADQRQIDVSSPLHRAAPVLKHVSSVSFPALLSLVLPGRLFLHCLNDLFSFIFPKSLTYAYILFLCLVPFVLLKSTRKEWGGEIIQGFVLHKISYIPE